MSVAFQPQVGEERVGVEVGEEEWVGGEKWRHLDLRVG